MLLEQGYGVQRPEWYVRETKAPGFSRAYYVERGTVCYHGGGGDQPLLPGHLYLFPSHAPFSITHQPEDPICCLWYHLNLFPVMVTRLITVPVSRQEGLAPLLEAFRWAVLEQPRSQAYLQALAEALVLYLRHHGFLEAPEESVLPWITYIQRHCAEDRPVEEIGRQFGYTPEHFIRLFHRKVGMTPGQYRIHCRLNKALDLLRRGQSVASIAQAVGYGDSKSFSRAFRVHYGLSPQQYRQQDRSRA